MDAMCGVILNEDQQAAEDAIFAAYARGETEFLLIGAAGTGKTTLMQSVCRKFTKLKKNVGRGNVVPVVTAPTHKAVSVLAQKMNQAGLNSVARMTIHSLLGLKPTVNDSEKQVLKRNPASSVNSGYYDLVVIDESSMVGLDLQTFINKDLKYHFVLYVADEAQLPPVGEDIAPCFKKIMPRNTFRLTRIVRQAEGNPILQAATILRLQQGTGRLDWSWTAPAVNEDAQQGIYHCGGDADLWLRQAFTSDEFKADNDAYRYIAYTNSRVKEVNNKIREWIYGKTDTPFVADERVVCRNPVLNDLDLPIFSTNEEAIVISIEEDLHTFEFSSLLSAAGQKDLKGWHCDIPVWKILLCKAKSKNIEKLLDENYEYEAEHDNEICFAYMVKNEAQYKEMERRLIAEGKANRNRWKEYFLVKEKIADIRPVYAMTAHSSQGSTFGVAFLDVPDMAKRARDNILECQKLMYVAVTRASKAVVLIGV